MKIPEYEREPLVEYLRNGDAWSPREREHRVIMRDRLREKLLRAGYTDLSLQTSWFGGHREWKWARGNPELPKYFAHEGRLYFILEANSERYQLEKGWHDALKLREVIPNTKPDFETPAQDPLRTRVLDVLDRLPSVQEGLKKAGKEWFSLGRSWNFKPETEEVKFWLNPYKQTIHQAGWYTLAELDQWRDNEGPVTAKRV